MWLFALKQNFYELWIEEELEKNGGKVNDDLNKKICQAVLYTYTGSTYTTLLQRSIRLKFNIPVDKRLFAVSENLIKY